jgi:hypothetical protein
MKTSCHWFGRKETMKRTSYGFLAAALSLREFASS